MSNYKKKLKVALIILIIFLIFTILFQGTLKILGKTLGYDYMNCDEFKVYYEQNQDDFDYVAKELLLLSDYMKEDDESYGTIEKISVFKRLIDQGRYCDYIGKGLAIYPAVLSNIDYRFDEIQKIEIKKLKSIFKDGNIISIKIRKNHIRFYNRTGIGFSNCIIYSQDTPPFEDAPWAVNYVYIPIADNWYYLQED